MILRLTMGILMMLALGLAPVVSAGDGPIVRYSTQDRFESVRESVELAITGRGMVISSVSHVGEMLERTGKDLGATRQVYRQAEIVEFCSAAVSRRMMEADPHNIVSCPFSIAIYVLSEEPDTVYLAYRRPVSATPGKSEEALRAVEELLDGIVQDALAF
ncbi:MAG: DUF302 domain-containing protein [Gammaproteobacteria bacterium]